MGLSAVKLSAMSRSSPEKVHRKCTGWVFRVENYKRTKTLYPLIYKVVGRAGFEPA